MLKNKIQLTVVSPSNQNELSTDANKYRGKFPHFRQPTEVGRFSHDNAHNFVHDSSSLKTLKLPIDLEDVYFDLKINYDTFIEKDNTGAFINSLLKWTELNKTKFVVEPQEKTTYQQDCPTDSLNTDFICWRGLLTKILCTPFENRDPWKIAVIKYNGTHFMCEYDTEKKMEHERNVSEREKQCRYWGFKFEQYLCVENEGDEADTSIPVNNNAEYGVVIRTRLHRHSLVYGGEVDGYQVVNGERQYVELKTQLEPDNKRIDISFRQHKLKKWWAQSFLLGIRTIICGFRDHQGVVHRLHPFNTFDLPKMAADLRNPWEPSVCFNFLDTFLQFVKDTVSKDNPRFAYVFEWDPADGFVRWREEGDNPEYCFLPVWFYDKQHSRTSHAASAANG